MTHQGYVVRNGVFRKILKMLKRQCAVGCRKCDSLRIVENNIPTSPQNVIDNVEEKTAVESDRRQRLSLGRCLGDLLVTNYTQIPPGRVNVGRMRRIPLFPDHTCH